MTLEERITESEQRFELKKQERDKLLQSAEECLTEMTKLQGEWRMLQELLNEQKSAEEPNKQHDVIEAPDIVESPDSEEAGGR